MEVIVETPPCTVCGEASTLVLQRDAVIAYVFKGAKVQEAFPDLSADQRELLMTGTHPKCWKLIFQGEE